MPARTREREVSMTMTLASRNDILANYSSRARILASRTMYPPINITKSPKEPFTDYSRWRLLVNDGGRHTWHYLKTDEECEKWPQNTVDKYWLGLQTVLSPVFLRVYCMLIWSWLRACLTFLRPKMPLKLQTTGTRFTETSSHTTAIGRESMEDPCFSFLASSLVHMSRTWTLKRKNASR